MAAESGRMWRKGRDGGVKVVTEKRGRLVGNMKAETVNE